MAYYRPQPSGEACRPAHSKPPQALKIPLAQLLAGKKEAIVYGVGIDLKEPHHLKDERGIELEKIYPGLPGIVRSQTAQNSKNLPLFRFSVQAAAFGPTLSTGLM